MKSPDLGRCRPGWSRRLVLLGALWLALPAGPAGGQVTLEDYPRPILARNALTHYANIKDLAFARDGGELLSAGYDKVIHVWDLRNPSTRPARTLRPPIFKGEMGQIWSIALSPIEVDGQRLLAVGGYSPGNDRGSIVLMRYPGRGPAAAGGTGDIVGYLQRPRGQAANPDELSEKVTRLAFTRDGRRLVAADAGGSLKAWDLDEVGKARRTIDAVSSIPPTLINPVPGPRSPITGMVLAGDANADDWIIAGDVAGNLTYHDLGNRRPPFRLRPFGEEITCLAGGRALGWVVAGTVGGRVRKVDLAGPAGDLEIKGKGGPILAVDASLDGRKIAVSLRNSNGQAGDPPSINLGGLLLYESVDGRDWSRRPLLLVDGQSDGKYPIEAVRFGPGLLAFGGDRDQKVVVREGPGFSGVRLRAPGEGSAIWDVGFVDQPAGQPGLAIFYSKDAADYAKRRAVGNFPGFDLSGRLRGDYPASRAFRLAPVPGVNLVVGGPYTFQASTLPAANPTITLPARDGRWSSYLVLPPAAPGRPPLLVVGTNFHISVYNLATGRRTRVLQGHESTVTALGASRDGKWLISGSADQSIRLWAIKDYDRVEPFGAVARVVAGKLNVDSVVDGGFAQQRGLRAGDVVDEAFLEPENGTINARVPLEQLLARADALEAGHEVVLRGQHAAPGQALALTARKHTPPALSLFLNDGFPREWVLWAPQGFYATSIQGDDRFLGWHRNQILAARQANPLFTDTERTLFSPISQFKQQLENPGFIDRLVASNDPIAEPVPPIPPIFVADKPRLTRDPDGVKIETAIQDPNRPTPPIEAIGDGKPLPIAWKKLGASYIGTISRKDVESLGRAFRLIVGPAGGDGGSTPAVTDVVNPPSDPARPGRFVFFGCGVDGAYPRKVAGAGQDVTDLWAFFSETARPISPADEKPIGLKSCIPILPNKSRPEDPPGAVFLDQVDRLEREMGTDGRPTPDNRGDVLLVHVEARSLFEPNLGGQILLADGKPGVAGPATTKLLKDQLAEVVRTGCRVYVFLDIVHEANQDKHVRDARDGWVRDLLDAGVCCFLASKDKPSLPRPGEERPGLQNRQFARSILDVFDGGGSRLTFEKFAEQARQRAIASSGEKSFDPDYLNYWSSARVTPLTPFVSND